MTYLEYFNQLQQRAEALSKNLSDENRDSEDYASDHEDCDSEDHDTENHEHDSKMLHEILQDVCKVVQNATSDESAQPEMPSILECASNLLEMMVEMAYDKNELYDFVPSYAHGTSPLVADPAQDKNGIAGLFNSGIFELFHSMFNLKKPSSRDLQQGLFRNNFPTNFNLTPKPHPKTSPIARFRTEHPIPTVPATAPAAQAVLHGCCSVLSEGTNSPIRLHTVPNSDILVFSGAGGWKNRDPIINYFRLESSDSDTWGEFPETVYVEHGLLDMCFDLAVDPSRKLIYAGEKGRVKSFTYKDGEEYLATHTLKSRADRSGPLALVDNGARLLRAGKGGIDVWNVDSLPTHGPKGSKRIGKGRISVEDSWRDDTDEVETSAGSPRDASIDFSNFDLEISSWCIPRHWSTGGTLKALCFPSKTWSTVLQMDLEHGGRIVSRYLGHAGQVYNIQSSEEDQNTFMTTSGDGVVRLFDIREPLPKVSFDAGGACEHIYAALYVHVDGIPILFSGGTKSESIKVWDVRSPKLAYELATGNNSVASLAWDGPRSTLYAATECEYMDRLGFHHDYRQARIKPDEKEINDLRGQTEEEAAAADAAVRKAKDPDMDEDDEEDDETDEEEYDEEKCWPNRAYHDERYFGYAFDSGDHCILRYKFGLDADLDFIPAFGNARCGDEMDSFW